MKEIVQYAGCQYNCYLKKTKRGNWVFCRRTDKKCRPETQKAKYDKEDISVAAAKILSIFEKAHHAGTSELHIDDIIAQTGLPPSLVSTALLKLELVHFIKQLPQKYFALNLNKEWWKEF